MRIAYIAPYQGSVLLRSRPIVRNLALAGNVKIELVAELLKRSGHHVEILSQGEVIERRFKFYHGFSEPNPSRASVPVFYASALPVKLLNGLWSTFRTLVLFKARHRVSPFDLVMIYNLKLPQVICAKYAMRRLGLPAVLEYEDDAFVDVGGRSANSLMSQFYFRLARQILNSISAGVGVSPHLLSQLPSSIPRYLLRGVVSDEILESSNQSWVNRKNWVVYSGTHYRSKGLEPLIAAWKKVQPHGWELHIAGHGELTAILEEMAKNDKSIVFHGLLNRQENARFLAEAKIGVNPHDLSHTPGNVFAFKIIEYLAAGTHVITTPMGTLEAQIEVGITYMADNTAETIGRTLKRVITCHHYEHTATQAALGAYGPDAVRKSLDDLLNEVRTKRGGTSQRNGGPAHLDSRSAICLSGR